MKVIVAGGRNIEIYEVVLLALQEPGPQFYDAISEVVSGGAFGVDLLGEIWAITHQIPVKKFPADWKKYGQRAGPLRNAQMARYADALVLVWDGESKGSRSMLEKAEVAGIPVYEFLVTIEIEELIHDELPV